MQKNDKNKLIPNHDLIIESKFVYQKLNWSKECNLADSI